MIDDKMIDPDKLETTKIDSLLKFFQYGHLPEHLQKMSKRFHDLAHDIHSELPDCDQRHYALMKLLEAKDCAVRARI
jgi:hypothetical protein